MMILSNEKFKKTVLTGCAILCLLESIRSFIFGINYNHEIVRNVSLIYGAVLFAVAFTIFRQYRWALDLTVLICLYMAFFLLPAVIFYDYVMCNFRSSLLPGTLQWMIPLEILLIGLVLIIKPMFFHIAPVVKSAMHCPECNEKLSYWTWTQDMKLDYESILKRKHLRNQLRTEPQKILNSYFRGFSLFTFIVLIIACKGFKLERNTILIVAVSWLLIIFLITLFPKFKEKLSYRIADSFIGDENALTEKVLLHNENYCSKCDITLKKEKNPCFRLFFWFVFVLLTAECVYFKADWIIYLLLPGSWWFIGFLLTPLFTLLVRIPPLSLRQKLCETIIGILRFFIVALMIIIFYPITMRYLFNIPCHTNSQEFKEIYEFWYAKRLDFIPEEELTSVPFSEKTTILSESLKKLWIEKKGKDHLLRFSFREKLKNDLSVPNLKEVEEELQKHKDLLTVYKSLVLQPDYEMDALPLKDADLKSADDSSYPPPEPDFQIYYAANTLIILETKLAVQQKKFSDASYLAEIIIRSAKGHNYLSVSELFNVSKEYGDGADIWNYVMEECEDPASLRHALTRQNDLRRDTGFFSNNILSSLGDEISLARRYNRIGFNIKIKGHTERSLWGQLFLADADYCEKFILPRVVEPGLRDKLLSSIKENRMNAVLVTGYGGNYTPLWPKITSWAYAPLIIVFSIPSGLELYDKIARVKFDLLRLNTAWKLFRLEHGREPLNAEELVPAYFPQMPKDIFSRNSNPYLRGSNPELMPETRFYSVGPNGTDECASKLYDPKTKKSDQKDGDIFLVVQ